MDYPWDTSTPTADLSTVKMLLDSVVSMPGARFVITADIKNFYLNTPMKRYEYMQMRLDLFPEKLQQAYGLRELADSEG